MTAPNPTPEDVRLRNAAEVAERWRGVSDGAGWALNQLVEIVTELRAQLAAEKQRGDALAKALTDHNDELQQICDSQQQTGRCEAYLCRGRACVDCPRGYAIECAALAGAGEQKG